MGRPPLGNIATMVRLPAEMIKRIDAIVGRYGRAAFIRRAVADALNREEGEPPTKT